jgi:hypothetical protein
MPFVMGRGGKRPPRIGAFDRRARAVEILFGVPANPRETAMDRRDFLKIGGVGLGALILPTYGRHVAAEVLLTKMDAATKKKLADVALGAAKSSGATYCDVRIGRYLASS